LQSAAFRLTAFASSDPKDRMTASTNKNVIFAALAGNLAIAATKLIAALITGSAAMMSEAIHSAVDTGNQVLLLIGLRRAARPATESHPFGHGLQLYFYTFVVSVLIFGVGAVVSITHGIDRIRAPEPIENPWVNYLILGLSILFEGMSWFMALKAFNKDRGDRPFFEVIRLQGPDRLHRPVRGHRRPVRSGRGPDRRRLQPGVQSAAAGRGRLGVIGVILAATAAFLAFESQSLLTGEAADPATREGIRAIAAAETGVEGLNDARTMHFGPNEILVCPEPRFPQRPVGRRRRGHGRPAGTENPRRLSAGRPHLCRGPELREPIRPCAPRSSQAAGRGRWSRTSRRRGSPEPSPSDNQTRVRYDGITESCII
jgi:hypothetical protein